MQKEFRYGRVIIEPHTYCNRKCKFCLINYMDDKYKKNVYYMSDDTLYKILNFIYENKEYFKLDKLTFSLFKYNEPLYDIDNLIHIAKTIKEFFRLKGIDTYLYIHSNGDYLTKYNFERIIKYLDKIYINDYEDLSLSETLKKISTISNKFKLIDLVGSDNNLGKKDKIVLEYFGKKIIFYYNSNKHLLLVSRGSIVNKYLNNENVKWKNNCEQRNYNCDIFNRILSIDYNGNIFLCSELSSRIKQHSELIIGNIHNITINDLNIDFDYKKYDSCKFCHMENKYCSFVDEDSCD